MNKWIGTIAVVTAISLTLPAVHPTAAKSHPRDPATQGTEALKLDLLARYDSGAGMDRGGAEIVAIDSRHQRVYSVNGDAKAVDVLDLSALSGGQTQWKKSKRISLDSFDLGDFQPGDVTSVTVHPDGKWVAAAVPADPQTDDGIVVILDADGHYLNHVQVGALPDMVTVTPDGTRILSANEGESNDDYTIDPEGSVSIIDVSKGVNQATVTTVGFGDLKPSQVDKDVRVFGKGASFAQDMEPEYIQVTPDGNTAYVALQENNAIAKLNLKEERFERVYGLGVQDHSVQGNELDASDRDGRIHIRNWPVLGLYQPDGFDLFQAKGKTYLITANEGDARGYKGFSEEARVKDLVHPDKAGAKIRLNAKHYEGFNQQELDRMMEEGLLEDDQLGRLRVSAVEGKKDGVYEALYSFGSRSFSIWEVKGDKLKQVYDSGSDFERIIADVLPEHFNSNHRETSFDTRSDDKGPEPESAVVGQVGDRLYAFIGLERVGGVMVYDVTQPNTPHFVTYFNSRDFSVQTGDVQPGDSVTEAGDLGPEGLAFLPADQSPTGDAILLVANEVSGTVAAISIKERK
ncbi:choice-of-anchor I family protein [Desmospora profundinema]|uniref:Choice-of-anchor I domain-containing protein n=1 Tax=Desmospora profundinema TaxID=1571184 RepID=A0ABU1IP40_9BACL|nr:choice-of-anchor I family protein [Desmospora profundinema]MDR6226158.1 hypothetical protein [Desmospora profundinema]